MEHHEKVNEVAFKLAMAALGAVDGLPPRPDGDNRRCPHKEAAEAVRTALYDLGLVPFVVAADGLLVEAMASIRRLKATRLQAAAASVILVNAERLLKVEEAKAEVRAAEAAGGKKNLGPNVEACRRALVIAVAEDEDYQKALDLWRRAYLDHEAAKAEVEAERERLAVLKAALWWSGAGEVQNGVDLA